MRTVDISIFLVYLTGILVVGFLARRRGSSPLEFHVAGRTMRWFPIALSITATLFSAINYTQFSGEVYGHGLYVLMVLPAFVLIAEPVRRWVMPFFHRRQLVSAYEYLEQRFDRRVRRLASATFILWRLFWVATVLYATAKLLSAITGMSVTSLIILTGVVTTAYTVAGGMRSVMWTDVVQFFVLAGSVAAALVMAIARQGGWGALFDTAAQGGLLRPFYPFDPQIFSLDPTVRMTLWSCLIGSAVAFFARYGVDQMVVQRYFTAASLDDARRGFVLNIVLTIASRLALGLLGLALYAFIAAQPGAAPKSEMASLAMFIQSLPYGICGLLVSGLCASTMASADSGIHSCTTALMTDFPVRSHSQSAEGGSCRSERLTTLAVGCLGIALAFYVGRLGSIFEIANKVINAIGSPLLALFLAGWFGRGMTARGVLAGGILGLAGSIYAGFFLQNLALHYYAVVNLLGTFVLCWVCSRIPERK